MIEILVILGAPIAGAALLASIGAGKHAAEINVGTCLVTFIAAVALALRVVAEGPLLLAGKIFFVDPSTYSSSR